MALEPVGGDDHLHDVSFTVERWVTVWERQFGRLHQDPEARWQAHAFHHRLRRQESYTEKWNYVRENPLSQGLIKDVDDWPYQGMMNSFHGKVEILLGTDETRSSPDFAPRHLPQGLPSTVFSRSQLSSRAFLLASCASGFSPSRMKPWPAPS
jgi:hypothetical protein